jgi:hypothetical protein
MRLPIYGDIDGAFPDQPELTVGMAVGRVWQCTRVQQRLMNFHLLPRSRCAFQDAAEFRSVRRPCVQVVEGKGAGSKPRLIGNPGTRK